MVREPVEAVLLGAGSRGLDNFGAYAERFPYRIRFIAVAEPMDDRREEFARRHRIPRENIFRSWRDLLDRPQMAPALINATMDRTHLDSTLAAIEKGYHILLEKPMSADAPSCVRIARAAQTSGKILQICHNMRYTSFYQTLKQLLQEKRAGDIVTVQHNEHIAFWHMTHSFVRGKWGNERCSSPMILAKSCHDMDILVWLIDKKPTRVFPIRPGETGHSRPLHRRLSD
jgi:predicted dehydrogenase